MVVVRCVFIGTILSHTRLTRCTKAAYVLLERFAAELLTQHFPIELLIKLQLHAEEKHEDRYSKERKKNKEMIQIALLVVQSVQQFRGKTSNEAGSCQSPYKGSP